MSKFTFEYKNNFKKFENVESELLYSVKNFEVTSPVFTIFIPTYKRAHLLKNSFEHAIRQNTKKNFEIVVCDNNNDPTDLSGLEVVKELVNKFNKSNLNVFFYKNKDNLGQIGNWNRGIELSNGKYIVMCHDDDWLEHNILKMSEKYISLNKGIAFQMKTNDFRKGKTFGQIKRKLIINCARIFADIFFSHKVKDLSLYDNFIRYMNPGNSGVVFEKEKLVALGGYEPEVFPLTDFYMFARYIKEFGIVYVKKYGSDYRIAENESLTAAVKFPKLRYDLMCSEIPFINSVSEDELKEIALCVYVDYVKDASVFWGIEENKFDPIDVEYDVTDKEFMKKVKKISRKVNYQVVRRYF